MVSVGTVQPMPNILFVEDDLAMVAMLRAGLSYQGFTVRVATNGLEAWQSANDNPPDLILLDWMLPGMDGLSLCRRFRQLGQIPIIMLTARDAIQDRVAGLEAGADDYLIKPFHLDELIARIRARLRNREPTSQTLSFADLILDLDLREAERNGQRITLTATEFQLLLFLMRHPRQVLTKEQILETVWGYNFGGDGNIVEQYIRSLRRKLGLPNLIQTMRLAGYVLREGDS